MGVLEHSQTGRRITLAGRCLLGRHPSCDVRVEDGRVSGEHASLHWVEGRWELRDLGSRNGTYLEGRRLTPGERVALEAGRSFMLGNGGVRFLLLEAGPPAVRARDMATDLVREAIGSLLVLPDDETPQASLFLDEHWRWVLETGEERRVVVDQERFWVGGSEWRVELPIATRETVDEANAPTLRELHLRIGVSRDEEHVEVRVAMRGEQQVLPVRSSHYLLVLLARIRLGEHALRESEQGWVEREELCRMLRTDTNKLNVDIHRVRKQFSALRIQDAATVVERRPGTGLVRLGVPSVEVFTL